MHDRARTGGEHVGDLVENGVMTSRENFSRVLKYAQAGRFISSVTHDVNNFLGAIMAYAELIEMDSKLSDDSKRMLGEVREAVLKSTNLLGTLSLIAQENGESTTFSRVTDVVDRVLNLLRYELKLNQTELQTITKENFDNVLVDEPALSRVLIHLVANAMEQLANAEGKRIKIVLQKSGDAIELAVHNSGQPVPEPERELIFGPFYSNKGEGHFGLGLTEAREIARSHQGDLVYDTERGFVIRWPNEFDQAL